MPEPSSTLPPQYALSLEVFTTVIGHFGYGRLRMAGQH